MNTSNILVGNEYRYDGDWPDGCSHLQGEVIIVCKVMHGDGRVKVLKDSESHLYAIEDRPEYLVSPKNIKKIS